MTGKCSSGVKWIWPIDSQYFGEEATHGGGEPEAEGKTSAESGDYAAQFQAKFSGA